MWILLELSFWALALTGVILSVTNFKYFMWTTLFCSLALYLLSPCLIELGYHLVGYLQLKFKLRQKQHEEFVYNINQRNYIPIIFSEGYDPKAC